MDRARTAVQTTGGHTWVAVGLVVVAATAATAWAVLTFATVRGTHATKTPAPAKLTASEQAYVRGIASLDYEQIAAAYNPAWRGEQSSATVVKGLGPRERRYVQGILRLTPEQVRAGFGTVQP